MFNIRDGGTVISSVEEPEPHHLVELEPQLDAALMALALNQMLNMDRFWKNVTNWVLIMVYTYSIHIDNNCNHGKPLVKKSEP
jgi:hypothetical protein